MRTLLSSLVVLLACGDGASTSGGGAGGDGGSGAGDGAATSTAGRDTGGSTAETGGAGGELAGGAGAGAGASAGGTGAGAGPSEFAPDSLALCDVINDYRVSLGMPAIPVSVALMTVAEAHVADLVANPGTLTPSCNLHSWSDQGPWTACCYTPDHAAAQCMWSKPAEITAGWGANTYSGNGYEISASGASTPEQALALWQSSPPHHDIIRNLGAWGNFSPWPAVGCGMGGGYAMVWFGDATDPQTLP
jgi:hypothetical protein